MPDITQPIIDESITKALAKLVRLRELRRALAALNDLELSQVFRVPYGKRALGLHQVDRAIREVEQHIEWLQTTKPLYVSPAIDAAWQRDINQWSAQGSNTD